MSSFPDLTTVLERFDDVRFAVLFGSHARGTARPDSDLDVAVFLSPALSPEARWDVRLRLQTALDAIGTADVVVLNDAPALLAHRALQGQRVLLRDPVAWVRFCVSTIARSEDERYYREIHRAARERRLEEGRFGRP
jgi:hypothetical protein